MRYIKIFLRKVGLPALCSVLMALPQLSCTKYLDKKPQDNLAVPSTLRDMQAILDDQSANQMGPGFTEFVADNFYLTTASWSGLVPEQRKTYLWAPDAKIVIESGSWNNPYQSIYRCNMVLEILPKINVTDAELATYNNVKGMALFYRSFMFHQLAQLYCKPYSTSAASDPGIVLRTTTDLEIPVTRATVQQTYERIINDAKEAAELLPVTVSYNLRPNKAAAYALLSRTYLSMRDYVNAEATATQALQHQDTLLDYNILTPAGNPSLPDNPLLNPETLFASYIVSNYFGNSRIAIVDPVLYGSYVSDDLRKTTFYGITGIDPYWKGSYYANGQNFSIFLGLATDEVYLNRAEARARRNDVAGAMDDLNKLLVKRWKTGTFTNLTAANGTEALEIILTERRKELAFRGIRWSDLRRLNLEGANITLTREVNNTTYTLPPNDLRWVLLIPEVEINRSGIAQNPR
jgi:tetratricopeptide (TPR) repeat protein